TGQNARCCWVVAVVMHIERELESEPASWPDAPEDLTARAAAIPPGVVWSRLEQYIARRWEVRTVVWSVTGWGAFVPRLQPADLDVARVWTGAGGWHDCTADLQPAPDGVLLTGGTYELEYSVGDSSASTPDRMLEAYRR